jgi:hypothetical protein
MDMFFKLLFGFGDFSFEFGFRALLEWMSKIIWPIS